MSLPLVYYPDGLLKLESNPIPPEEISSDLNRALVDQMIETMYYHDGVGLSAIQVGNTKRLFVLDVGAGPEVYFNPIITDYEGDMVPMEGEGCLSVPGFYATVQRHVIVRGYAFDRDGNKFGFSPGEGAFDDCSAEQNLRRYHAIQHEYEHLNGEIFLDHLSHVQRDRARSWMKKVRANIK